MHSNTKTKTADPYFEKSMNNNIYIYIHTAKDKVIVALPSTVQNTDLYHVF